MMDDKALERLIMSIPEPSFDEAVKDKGDELIEFVSRRQLRAFAEAIRKDALLGQYAKYPSGGGMLLIWKDKQYGPYDSLAMCLAAALKDQP